LAARTQSNASSGLPAEPLQLVVLTHTAALALGPEVT
jgi:hypothetical protein